MREAHVKKRFAPLAAAVLWIAGGACAIAQSTGWPQLGHSSFHDSYSPDSAISTSVAPQFGVAWMANLFSADLGSPVVAYNATLGKNVVYVGNERGDVFALDAATGQVIWSTNIGVNDKLRATPAVAPDGSVWVGTTYNPKLIKLDGATGAIDCSSKAQFTIDASPMVATLSNGSSYIFWAQKDAASVPGPTKATNIADCSTNWSFTGYLQNAGSWGTPVYGVDANANNLVLVGTSDPDSTLYAIDAQTGLLHWDFTPTQPPGNYDIGDGATTSAPGNNGLADGVVYFNTKYGIEWAVDLTTGSPIWQFSMRPYGSRSSAALDGNSLVFGYENSSGGVYNLNATTGALNWQYPTGDEVISSPAIVGPSGSEVVAFGDINGSFRLIGLSDGTAYYKYQTRGYITSSPAEANGNIFIASSDGFLYAFGANGGNAAPPQTAISYPANQSVVANPNGTLTITGSSTDAVAVTSVEIALQTNGSSGTWYNAANGTYGSAPMRNQATVSSPGSPSSPWSFTFPAPPAGGTYTVYANTVNSSNIVDRGTISTFTISPSSNEPNVTASPAFASPTGTVAASGAGFNPSEKVALSFFGKTIKSVKANKSGAFGPTTVQIPGSAGFGQTSLTATGQTSGKSSTASVYIANNWTQFGHDSERTSSEPHDQVIAQSIDAGNNTVLSESWYYQAGAPVNTSPAIFNGISYFGNDTGTLTALVDNTGAPAWSYTLPSSAVIRSSPAVDSAGSILFGAADGNLYSLTPAGALGWSLALGGNLTAPSVGNGQIFIGSDTGNLYDVADPAGTITWTATMAGAVHSPPAYDPAGTVVVGDDSGAVTALNAATGAQLWQVTTGGAVTAAPMIYNGTVYVGSADANLYAINESTGAVSWKYQLDGPVTAGTAVFVPSSIAVGTTKGTLYRLSPTGSLMYSLPNKLGKTSIVGVAGVKADIFVETAAGTVAMIRINNGKPFVGWAYQTASTLATSPVIVDGTVYVGANDGGLYTFTPQGANPMNRSRQPSITITDANGWACTAP